MTQAKLKTYDLKAHAVREMLRLILQEVYGSPMRRSHMKKIFRDATGDECCFCLQRIVEILEPLAPPEKTKKEGEQ